MICGECPEGKHYMRGSVYCLLYGIIINEKHICTRDGGNRHDRDGDHSTDGKGTAELQEDSCGAAGSMPVVLSGSGEREGIPGMEETKEWKK